MRLLFLVGRDPEHPQAGGGDVQAWEYARYAAATGHEVTYVCLGDPDLPQQERVDGISVIRFEGPLGLPLKAWKHYRRRWAPYDVIFEDVIGASRIPYLSRLYAKAPVVVAWHQVNAHLIDGNYPVLARAAVAWGERMLARVNRKCFLRCPSEVRRHELHRELGFSLERIRVVKCTIPDEWLERPAGNGHRRGSRLTYLGNIRRYKRIHDVISALNRLVADFPDIQLTIAGRVVESRYHSELLELASASPLRDRISFRYNISEEEKKELLSNTTILVLPSTLEGFGIVTLEANACGVPVVASEGVPEEAVSEGVNGLRYNVGDIDALAGCIARILGDRALNQMLTRTSIEHARSFSWSVVGAEFIKLMNDARDIRRN